MKIKRRGRHAAPSQAEKVAAQAGRAAPAVAIAGALVTVPAQQAIAGSAQVTAVAAQASQAHTRQVEAQAHTRQALVQAQVQAQARQAQDSGTEPAQPAQSTESTAAVRYYTVSSGDTLSRIARRFYHNAADWQYLYHVNDKTITNPNLIYAGQRLRIPASVPAHYALAGYSPRHAKPARNTSAPDRDGDSDDSGGSAHAKTATSSSGGVVPQSASQGSAGRLSGTLNCSGLERLWDAAGGNPAAAFTAAEIAMAESGGNQYALSPTRDYGYWQINASNGPLATFSAYGNARAAITISRNGTNWSAWTTYTSGAYAGRC